MKRYFLVIVFTTTLMLTCFPGLSLVFAQQDGLPVTGVNSEHLPTLGLEDEKDPVRAAESLLLNYVINPIFLVSAGVAVIVIFYASFRIIAARGEEEGLTAAKNTLIWAAAGLALIVLAYALVSNIAQIVLERL
ncbi:MAG: pilin [bacterium]|nr:pilin [bacterium]